MPGQIETLNFYTISSLILDIASQVFTKTIISVCNRLNTTFEDLLRLNKHRFFHLWQKDQCCLCASHPENSQLTLSESQWDILYEKNDTRCQLGSPNVCSCSYGARAGINVEQLDSKLAATVLENLHCMNKNEHTLVSKLRELKKKLFQYRKTESMDETTFQGFWDDVRNSLGNLLKQCDSESYEKVMDDIESLRNKDLDNGNVKHILERIDCEMEIISETDEITDCLNVVEKTQGNQSTCHNIEYGESQLYSGTSESIRDDQTSKETIHDVMSRTDFLPFISIETQNLHQKREVKFKLQNDEIIQDEEEHGKFLQEAKGKCDELSEKCQNFKREIQNARALLNSNTDLSKLKIVINSTEENETEHPEYTSIYRGPEVDWRHRQHVNIETVADDYLVPYSYGTNESMVRSHDSHSYSELKDRCQRINERCKTMKMDIIGVQSRINKFSRKLSSLDKTGLREGNLGSSLPPSPYRIMTDIDRNPAELKSEYVDGKGRAYRDYYRGVNSWERTTYHIHPHLRSKTNIGNTQPHFRELRRGELFIPRVDSSVNRNTTLARPETNGEVISATTEEKKYGHYLSNCRERWKTLNRKCLMMKQKLRTARTLFNQSSSKGNGRLDLEQDNSDPNDSSFNALSIKGRNLEYEDKNNSELDESYLSFLKTQNKTRSIKGRHRNETKDHNPVIIRKSLFQENKHDVFKPDIKELDIDDSFVESEHSSFSTYMSLKRAEDILKEIKGLDKDPDIVHNDKGLVIEEKDHGTFLQQCRHQSQNLSVKCDNMRRELQNVRRQFNIGPNPGRVSVYPELHSNSLTEHSPENFENESDTDSIEEETRNKFLLPNEANGRFYHSNARTKFVRSTDSGFGSLASLRVDSDMLSSKVQETTPSVLQDHIYSESKTGIMTRDEEIAELMSSITGEQDVRKLTALSSDHTEWNDPTDVSDTEEEDFDANVKEPIFRDEGVDNDTDTVALVAEKGHGQVLTNLKQNFLTINQRSSQIQKEIREARRMLNASIIYPVFNRETLLT